jgi:GTP-binding protein
VEKASWGKLVGDYLENATTLAGLILLLDSRRDPSGQDLDLIDWLAQKEMPGIAVVTKADKINRDKINRKVMQIEREFSITTIPFSTLSGVGKNEIMSAIEKLIKKKINLNI